MISFRSLVCVFLLISLAQKVPLAQADFFVHHWENHSLVAKVLLLGAEPTGLPKFHVELLPFVYHSDSNFNSEGEPILLSSGTYRRVGLDLLFETSLDSWLNQASKQRVSFFGRTGLAQVENAGLGANGSGTNWADSSLGANILLYSHPVVLFDLQIQVDFPLYGNSSQLTFGDRTIDSTAGLFAALPLLRGERYVLSSTVGAGYTYRNLGYSSAIPYSWSSLLVPTDSGVFLEATLTGIASLLTGDELPILDQNAGQSSYFQNSRNPSLAQLQGKFGYQFSPLNSLSLSITQTIWGEEAPNSFSAALAFEFKWGERRSSSLPLDNVKNTPHLPYDPLTIDRNRGPKVVKVVDRLHLVKINFGANDGIERGQLFDLSSSDLEDSPSIARARVISTHDREAALEIIEFFKGVPIEVNFSAKPMGSQSNGGRP